MHNISLTKTYTTGSGSVHVQVSIDNKDVGILYLSLQEAGTLVDTLKKGTAESGTTLTYNIFEDEFVDDEDLYYDEDGVS